MIRHIVVFRFEAGGSEERLAKFAQLRGALRPLDGRVPGLRSLRVDADPKAVETHWDAALISEHDTWEDLAAYQVHPLHQAAVEVVNSVATAKAVVDYEL